VTPVQILEGFRQLIERHGKRDSLVDEYLDVSKTELGRLKAMTGALKALTAAEKRRSATTSDATGITERIVKYYRELFPDLKFEASIEQCVEFRLDPVDLERIENILIDNAVKYGGSGGVVDIRLGKREFSVQDAGPGIAPEEREAVFERYRRGPGAEARGEGSGIGLAILKRFAEEYGFEIRLDNAPGGGSLFRLLFPSEASR
jgi:two-component system, OmpR family, sensor histidine kinase MtrB